MLHNMTVHITPKTGGSFFVTGSTTGRGAGGLNKHDFADAKALRGFLSGALGIHKREVDTAVASVSRVGSGTYPISHVMLTADQIEAHGLGPI